MVLCTYCRTSVSKITYCRKLSPSNRRQHSYAESPKSINRNQSYPVFSLALQTTQDSLAMNSSLWYALGGAFCIEVVGIVGVVR